MNTDERVGCLPRAHDLLGDPFGEVDRHRETEAGTRGLADRSVHADHFAGGADQWATAVARVHGGIRLDVGHPLAFSDVGIGASNGTDDACRDRVVQPERVPDGDGPFPRPQPIRVPKACHRQVVGHHLHHGHVRQWITAQHVAVEATTVGKRDRHPIRPTHHVFIGEDQAVGPGDEA